MKKLILFLFVIFVNKTITTMINQQLSIYIPHVFSNITKERIVDVFETQSVGMVERVDFIPKKGKDGKEYNTAFIHMKAWYNNECVVNLQSKIKTSNSTARIVYDDPWYWNLYENMNPRSLNELKLEEKIYNQNIHINKLTEEVVNLTTEVQKSDAFTQYLEDELNRVNANLFQLRDELGLNMNPAPPIPAGYWFQCAPQPSSPVYEQTKLTRTDSVGNGVSASIAEELEKYRNPDEPMTLSELNVN